MSLAVQSNSRFEGNERSSLNESEAIDLEGNPGQLILAIGAFISCFALVATLSGMMPILGRKLNLNEAQIGVALAMPMLMGALARIPVGILTDRLGGRRVFIGLMSYALVPACLMPRVRTYEQLLACAFLLGLPLAVFSAGVAFVSNWFPKHRRGTALGVLGVGNVGHSLALFGATLIASSIGFAWGFWAYAVLVAMWLCVIVLFAEDAPRPRNKRRRTLSDYVRPLADVQSWVLSLLYFLTFGGCLAMAQYLPKFLTLTFHLSARDAGFRAAGFVIVATSMRPVGGWLSDRIGPRKVLIAIFPIVALTAALMALPTMLTFTVGALAMAAMIGLGNGAVFTLVPEYFPRSVGTVTGLVGAAGALGGFFPPLMLGFIRQRTGSYTLGFALLGIFALTCLVTCLLTICRDGTAADTVLTT